MAAALSSVAVATKLVGVTPNDSTDISSSLIRALYIGTAGDVTITAVDDSASATFTSVPAGTIIPVSPKLVKATGTTATGIVGLI